MQDPFEPPGEPKTGAEAPNRPPEADLVPTEPEASDETVLPAASGETMLPAGNGDAALDPAVHGPMREIAAAFRMNAEALHSLKQMQADLAQRVHRGDRSEMVLQSTRALNDTFRNLSSVQRELLSRLDNARGGGRGPLIPLMLLGLLVVVVAGVYVILMEVQKGKTAEPAFDPAELVQRERDSWKEGRAEGTKQSEQEIRRLSESLEEAKERARTLQQSVDSKLGELSDIDRARRSAELERDEFAGQVRKAQNEVMAKKALEDEIGLLRSEKKATDREATDLEIALDRKRREVSLLRQRLADYGMDLPADDPPYVPPTDSDPAGPGAEPDSSEEPGKKSKFINLLTAGRRKIAEQDEAAGASSVPPPASSAGGPAFPRTPDVPRKAGALRGGDAEPAAAPPRRPGELPPPMLRRRPAFERDPVEVGRVRSRINQLLDAAGPRNGQSWQLTRIDGVSQSGLGGVILLRYDASGRLMDGIEAKDLRITMDRANRTVAFEVFDGVRVAKNQRVPLPARGARVVVAEGDASGAWASSGLTMIRKR